MSVRFAADDGVEVAYEDRPAPTNTGQGGGKATAVLVHGFASNRTEMWGRTGWLGAFERKGWRVVAPDLRGHGESDKPHDSSLYGRARLAADVVGLIERLELGAVLLMGYSLGAQVALEAALTRPDLVSDLVLGGVGGRLLQPNTGVSAAMAEAMEADDPATIAEPLLRSFRQFADEQGEDRLALAACVRARSEPLTAERVSSLRAPTLVVAGQRDQLAGSPDALAEAVPGARAATLPGCDHFSAIPHALYKASVFDWLDGWLE